MLRKKLHLILLSAALPVCNMVSAQLVIDNAIFTIQPGATVTVQGDVTSNTDIQGTGKILLKGTANQKVNMGGFNIPNLEVDNGTNATLIGAAKISGDLLFTNGKLELGNNNLTLGSAGTITNATSAKYVVTNGTGKLVKASLGNSLFVYPVGNSATSYNPVTLTNAGNVDDIGVRCLANALTAGTGGTPITKEVVDASWDITEASPGGSNLTVKAQWNLGDELSGFNRTKTGVSNYLTTPAASVGWDLLNSQTGAAAGAGPYTYERTGVTTLGAFAVGTRPVLSPLLVTPKVFLQGPFNTTLSNMNDNLRIANLIPLTEPYTAMTGFVHSGSGGGETSTADVVGSTSVAVGDNKVVDWVFVQLHRASDSVVVSTRAVLLQKDGDLVETDGVSPVNFAGNAAGSYYISVRHRNHLGVRSIGTLVLTKTNTSVTAFNFAGSLDQSFKGNPVNTNPVQATVTTGVFGLYGGNTVTDRTVRASGPASINDATKLIGTLGAATLISNTYSVADVNMDGTLRSSGPAAINDYTKLIGIIGALTTVNQPLF